MHEVPTARTGGGDEGEPTGAQGPRMQERFRSCTSRAGMMLHRGDNKDRRML